MSSGAFRKTAKLWLSDPATYPIIAIISFAVTGASFQIGRYATSNPDVKFDKQKRNSMFHFSEESGENWKAHRFRLANVKRNPINQSEQFDDLFAMEENKHVAR